MANKYIDIDKLLSELNKRMGEYDVQQITSEHPEYEQGAQDALYNLKLQLTSLQREQPDKETILRICKLHKAWSIIAPWENVEDFVITNWNSENIV